MRYVRVVNETRDVEVADSAGLADRYWLRLRGLLGRPEPRRGEGLLITPCRAVHMMGMKYAIDVVFLDRAHRVVGLAENLGPGARSAGEPTARHALELPSGTVALSGTEVGDQFSVTIASQPSLAGGASGTPMLQV